MVGKAGEFTNIRMVAIKVLIILSCTAELRRSLIYDELAGVSIDYPKLGHTYHILRR